MDPPPPPPPLRTQPFILFLTILTPIYYISPFFYHQKVIPLLSFFLLFLLVGGLKDLLTCAMSGFVQLYKGFEACGFERATIFYDGVQLLTRMEEVLTQVK